MSNILTKQEVDDFFKSFNHMIQDLIICCENIGIINQEYNGRNSFSIDSFLHHYVALAYSQCALTLSKLFVEKEKRSFKKFLNKLQTHSYDQSLRNILQKNRIDFLNGSDGEYDYLFKNKSEIRSEIVKTSVLIDNSESIINKIRERRDSYYAHFDPEKVHKIEVESLEEIKKLLSLAEEIYNRYFQGIYNSAFIFNVPMELSDFVKNIKFNID